MFIVLQGKGRMTTYWLLGEKNTEGNNEAVEVGSGSGLSLGGCTENTQPEQLLSQQANAPSITRWAKISCQKLLWKLSLSKISKLKTLLFKLLCSFSACWLWNSQNWFCNMILFFCDGNNFLESIDFSTKEIICCGKKKSWPVTDLGNKGPLNGTKLILDDHGNNLDLV